MKNPNNEITNLQLKIDSIKEYLYSDICKTCEEMSNRLKECEALLKQISNNETN